MPIPVRRLLTPVEIDDFIRGNVWTFAKTMPDQPHWYVTKYDCRKLLEWQRMVMTIREIGFRGRYRKSYTDYLRWEVDGEEYLYWTMGYPLQVTKVINRARDYGQVTPAPPRPAPL